MSHDSNESKTHHDSNQFIAARWNMHGILDSVKFGHAVRRVEFDEGCGKFRVFVEDVRARREKPVQVFRDLGSMIFLGLQKIKYYDLVSHFY